MRRFLHLTFYILHFAFISQVFATHNRAGEITYNYLGGGLYEITVTTYTKISSCSADRCEIVVDFGDGVIDTVPRSNGLQCPIINSPFGGCEPACGACGEPEGNKDIKKNEYKTTHLYNPGNYNITVDDPNRNEGIMNIPNSVNTTFFIETWLIVSAFSGSNSSPILTLPPIDDGCIGYPYVHNPGAIDPVDNDSLVYSLVPCLGNGGQPIQGYLYPHEVPGCLTPPITIDAQTGTVIWDSPVCQGEYNIAILIEEYRFGVKVGSVLRDMQITIEDCDNEPPDIFPMDKLCVVAGDTINQPVIATDPTVPQDVLELTATGEPLTVSTSPATFNLTSDSTGDFQWITHCEHVRNNTYNMIFKAEDNNPEVSLVDIETLEILVVAPAPKNPSATPFGNSIVLNWDASICTNADCYKIYRYTDSTGYIPDTCVTGVPASTGYQLIATMNSWSTTTYTDNSGLVHGQKYCYMVVACFSNGAISLPSVEFCAELTKDVPVITHVTINTTDASNGSDSIIWSKPTELDTIQFPGPYFYKVYRIDSNGVETIIGSLSHDTLAFVDTFFVDEPVNTTIQQKYRVDLHYQQNGLVGGTQKATSVFLSSAATDNQLDLSWSENVPWINTDYVVYRKNDMGGFDLLDTVQVQKYTDKGLLNGNEYCYYVKSIGGYSTSGIISPILNRSQIHCDTPFDNVAPCAPNSVSLESDCNLFQNQLTFTNPLNYCADDVVGYNIYYIPTFGGDSVLIQTIPVSSDTVFLHENLNSVAGCYAVTAFDSVPNESPLSDTVCADNCPEYELPNVFTPGGDGVNDLFRPFPYRYVARVQMTVFNRWGQRVFETIDPDILWDGYHRNTNQPCPAGVYYYVCAVYEVRLSGLEPRILKGYVHLIWEEAPALPPTN